MALAPELILCFGILAVFCTSLGESMFSKAWKAALATSILAKLSGAESSNITIREQLSLKKRGRPRRNPVQLQNETLATPEPKPIEVTSETPVLIEEQVQETQPLTISDNSELNQKETEQIGTLVNNQKLNFLQLLLQKIRPAARS